ncbi:BnaUnng05150D [Brassica napus]|uniref:(rape) hypothetical protein n=1 Tax=Brassica napus TaxID=3708 RepID=A0A078JXU1_BRANA|nr:unnamed protein product [Brassica napus]CDY72478.1 BnaUnng05150D [Brassica napus]
MTALPIIAHPSSPASFFHSGSPSATQAPVGILSFSPLPPLGESFYLAVTTPSPEVPFAQLFNSNSKYGPVFNYEFQFLPTSSW